MLVVASHNIVLVKDFHGSLSEPISRGVNGTLDLHPTFELFKISLWTDATRSVIFIRSGHL